MQHPTHDPAIIRHMIHDGYAQADSHRLAALAHSQRTPRPSLRQRVGGHLASVEAALLHRPASRTTARTIRP